MTDEPSAPSTDRNPSGPDGPSASTGHRPDGHHPSVPAAPVRDSDPSALDVARTDDPSTGRPPATRQADGVRDPYADDPTLKKDAERADQLISAYCILVVVGGIAGQLTGVTQDLHLPLWEAGLIVGALEMGGIVVFHIYDVRRRLGEPAVMARVGSFLIAATAAWLQFQTHTDVLRYVFPALTGLAYCVYVARTEFRRRDRQRLLGRGKPITPTYELVGHYLLHPWLTMRAKSLAKRVLEAGGTIGRYESFEAARAASDLERRNRALTTRLKRKFGSASALATTVYDPDRIAVRMRAQADNEAVADRMMVDLGIEAVASAPSAVRAGRTRPPVAPSTDTVRSEPQPEPVREVEPSAASRPTQPSAPKHRKPSASRPDGSSGIHLVWSPTVRRNAAELRHRWPDGLPVDARTGKPSGRQVREALIWSADKAKPAMQAYLAGADLDEAAEEPDRAGIPVGAAV